MAKPDTFGPSDVLPSEVLAEQAQAPFYAGTVGGAKLRQLSETIAADDAANLPPPPPEDDPVVSGLQAQGYGGPSRRDRILGLLAETEPVPSGPNPQAPIAAEYGKAMLGPEGLLEQQYEGHQQLSQAEVAQAEVYRSHYAAEEARLQAQADEQERQFQVQEMRRQEALDMERKTIAKIEELSERLNAAPDIDPDRYWNNLSAGRRFGWAVGAMMMGFAGLNPMAALNSAIERDIDSQKASFEQRKAGFASAMDLLGSQRNLYQDIRVDIEDEMVATDAVRLLRLQQAESALMKKLTENGVPMAEAQANIHLAEIGQAKAEKIASIKSRIASIPTRIGGGRRPVVRGDLRTILAKEYAREGDFEGDIRLEGFKQEGAIAKERAAGEVKREDQVVKDAAELGKRTSKWTNTLAAIDAAIKVAEGAGGKAPVRWTEERAAYDEAVARAEMHAGTAETGASVSPDQTEKIRSMLGQGRVSAWDKLDSLKRARDAVAGIIATEEAAFPEEVRQFRHRNANLPGIKPSYISEGMPASARRR